MAGTVFFFALLTLAGFAGVHPAGSAKPTITLLTVLPYETENFTPSFNEGHNIAPAVNLAVEMVNNSTRVLRNYTLDLVHSNGGCDMENKAFLSFVANVIHERSGSIAGVIGPGCSASTLAVLPLLNHPDVTLINVHGAGAPLTGDRDLFRNSLGVLGASTSQATALVHLIQWTGWRRMAVLFEDTRPYFHTIFDEFSKFITSELEPNAVLIASLQGNIYPHANIRRDNYRIIIVMAGQSLTRNLLCIAYHEGMLFPMYQWILITRHLSEFVDENVTLTVGGKTYACSAEVFVNTVLTGNILINYELQSQNSSVVTDSGLTYEQYLKLYGEKVEVYKQEVLNCSSTVSQWGSMYFDAVWALALAFTSAGFDAGLYHRGNNSLTEIVLRELYLLDFEGVSGPIKFKDSNGFVDRRISVVQVFDANEVLVGSFFNNSTDLENLQYISDSNRENTVALPVTVFFTITTLILSAAVVIVHIFTILYRKHQSIRATSNRLNQIIYIGCYLFCVAIVLHISNNAIRRSRTVHPKVIECLCITVWTWVFPISFTLVLGSIVARTWRLYRIFTHYLNPGHFISDKILIAFVIVLLLVDVVIGLVWTVVDPFRLDTDTFSVASFGGALTYEAGSCNSRYFMVWFAIAYGCKVILLFVAVALSLLTRNILNRVYTTKFLRVFVYTVSIVFSVGFAFYFILIRARVDNSIVSSVLYIVLHSALVLVLLLIFLPPFIPILREKLERYHCNLWPFRDCYKSLNY